MPAAYYEGNILVNDVRRPCTVGFSGLCRDYRYPNINSYDSVPGSFGYIDRGDVREDVGDKYDEKEVYLGLNLKREIISIMVS